MLKVLKTVYLDINHVIRFNKISSGYKLPFQLNKLIAINIVQWLFQQMQLYYYDMYNIIVSKTKKNITIAFNRSLSLILLWMNIIPIKETNI